jgi:hypothetical protein
MNLSPLTARSMSFLPQPQISEMSSAHQTPTKTGRSLPATAAALHAVEGESKGENVERAAERIVSLNQVRSPGPFTIFLPYLISIRPHRLSPDKRCKMKEGVIPTGYV